MERSEHNISPEERLLRLIRKPTKNSSGKQKAQSETLQASQTEKLTPRVSSPKKGKRKRLFLSGIFNLSKIKVPFSFELINRVLLVTLLILGIYLLFDSLIISPKKIILGVGEVKGAGLEISDSSAKAGRVEPVSYYSEPIKARNLFTVSAVTTGPTPASPTFMEMISKFRLQGIIAGADPQAIIEDIKTKQVYFLSPGERIGEIELKEILPGKVRLNYHGQEAELSL